MSLAGRLLACLPNLRCLQLNMLSHGDLEWHVERIDEGVQAALGPLKQATQLQELYLYGPSPGEEVPAAVARLLPVTLKRLSWRLINGVAAPNLSHMTQITYLCLSGSQRVTSANLPPRVQQLELWGVPVPPEVLQEQQQVCVAYNACTSAATQQLCHLTNLKTLLVGMGVLGSPVVRTALAQHTQLSALQCRGQSPRGVEGMQAAFGTMGSISSLRRLELVLDVDMPVPNLSGLTGVTHLVTWKRHGSGGSSSQHRALAEEIGRMAGLRWLSLPAEVAEAGWTPLAGLQLLQVLVVRFDTWRARTPTCVDHLVEECGRHGLPPRLQVLSVCGMPPGWPGHAADGRWSRLRQVLKGRGCEVVWGVNLDDVTKGELPDQHLVLAGLPVALQQVLA
jgi:hypothetical protein